MPVPSPRNSIRIARGNFADLEENKQVFGDGEFIYAIDQDRFYTASQGNLVPVGAGVVKAESLDSLADVNAPAPGTLDVLTWDGGEWVAAPALRPADIGVTVQPYDENTVIDPNYVATEENFTSADRVKLDGIEAGAEVNTVTSVSGRTGDVTLSSSDVGLGNADNTSDADKPISNATQSALDAKADLVGGKVPSSQLPGVAISEFLGEVPDEASMLQLDGEKGDWCIRTDEQNTYLITGSDPSQASSWTEIVTPESPVTSVNGQVGAVVLEAHDVNAVRLTGDNMTGNLTLDTDKVVLSTTGSATFAGEVDTSRLNLKGTSTENILAGYAGSQVTWLGTADGNFSLGNLSGGGNINLNGSDGSATFAARVNASSFSAGPSGGQVTSAYNLVTTSTNVQHGIFVGCSDSDNALSSNSTASISGDGSAQFASDVSVGTRYTSGVTLAKFSGDQGAGKIEIANPDGSGNDNQLLSIYDPVTNEESFYVKGNGGAEFAGRVDIGSNSLTDNVALKLMNNYAAAGTATVYVQNFNDSGQLWSGRTGSNEETSKIFADGSAEFGTYPKSLNITENSVVKYSDSATANIVCRKTDSLVNASNAFEVQMNTGDVTAYITGDGSADFAGDVDTKSITATSASGASFLCNGDGLYYYDILGNSTGFILADGSATFAGQISSDTDGTYNFLASSSGTAYAALYASDQTLKMGNLAATDYKITLDATDGSAMFSSGNVAISNGTNGEGKLEIYRTGAAADNSDVRDAFVMGVATNNMRGVLQTDGSLYLSDSHISNVDNAKTKIKGDGSAEFSNLVQIERDDTTVGGLASVFSFTGKVNGDLASRLVYKAGGALELRDEDNNANIELISNGNAKLQRGITQAFTLVNSIYDRPVFSLQDLEEHATVYPPSQGSGLHFNGNWVGLNGADGYGVSSEVVFGRSVPCLPRGWFGKIQLTAFAASNYGTAIRIETSDNNGLNWDIRAESSNAIEEETLVYERDSSNPVPTNTWVRIRMVAAAGTGTPAQYCRWADLVITNLPEFNTLFKGRDLLDFDGNLEVPGGKLTVTKESVPMIKLDDGGEYQAYMQLAGNDLEIRGSNGDMEFFTGVQDGQSSYERMRIKSNGNVGLGTSDPLVPFVISDDDRNLEMGYSGSTSSHYIQAYNRSDSAYTQLDLAGSELVFKTPTEAMRIDSSGNVGIGTGSPTQRLHLGESATGIRFGIPAAPAQGDIKYTASGEEFLDLSITGTTNGYGNIRFSTGPGATEAMRVDSSGRLLVGSSTYTGNGQVAIAGNSGGSSAAGILDIRPTLSRPTATNTTLSLIRFGSTDHTSNTGYASINVSSDGASSSEADLPGRLEFHTTSDGASSPTERFRITSDGLLQTGSPLLNAGGGWKVWLADPDTASQRGRMGFIANPSCDETQEVLQIHKNNVEALRINVAGNITNKNNSYGALSDAKLKENIVDASSQWEDLKAVQVRNYDLVATGEHHLGVVAQEIEQVSPGLVSEIPDSDEEGNDLGTVTKSVNYSVLYMKAVKALQEAMERIETLEQKVADLEG